VVALAGPDHGGTYQYTLSMLHALQHVRGFAVTLYGDPEDPELAALGFPVVPFSETRERQLAALAAHRLHIRLADPFASEDVLLAPIYALALLHTSKPFAYTLHDLQEKYYPTHFSLSQRVWRRQVHAGLLKKAGKVICESQHVKADIIGAFGVPEARIAMIVAPPQREFLAEQTGEQLQAVRARLQLPERYLFYPAQFWVHKNHLRLLEAFREVLKRAPDLQLVLTGKARDEYESVMRAVEQLGLTSRVRHLGFVERDELQAIYRLATALVMPSLFESVSIPVYEAFQTGTPVIASGVLAIPEQAGDAALLFDPNSVVSIRDAILKLLDDPALARSLGERGRARMLAMTPERYGAQLQELLEGLCAAAQNSSAISGKPG
jgi:glycosyltransferase involved in cell wall biosynthesis